MAMPRQAAQVSSGASLPATFADEAGGSLVPFLDVHALTVEQLFSSHWFHLPWFQRAYAWSEQHAGRLITDMVEAMDGTRKRYWLGHVFLASPEAAKPGDVQSGIIDGHQRAVTLTMICALLRDLAQAGPIRTRLNALIGSEDSGGLRLTPQPGVSQFFKAWVQLPGSTLRDPQGDILDLSEAERHLLNNRDHLRRMLRRLAPDAERREQLSRFVLESCVLIVASIDDEEEAWALLATAEETGLEFHSSERAKVSLITAMPRAEQEEASHLFEQAMTAVGADGMTSLLSHVRTLKMRRRSSKPVERELLERFQLNRSGIDFMREELVPRAEAMALINRRAVGDGQLQTDTARVLETLFWIDHQMWMPSALHWLASRSAADGQTPLFFAGLERLSYMLKIAGVDPTVQERRFLAVLAGIEGEVKVPDMPQLEIEAELRDAALENLRSRTFYSKRFHSLVLRRIAWNLAPERDPGPVDGKTVTIEHVLPRRPPRNGAWWAPFPTTEVIADHCNRLGNLAFLSLQENHHAGTNDFIVKRLLMAHAAPRFVIAEGAAKYTEWTPRVIMERTEDLIETLFVPWQLTVHD